MPLNSPLSPGTLINNRYRIVKLLGQGGFGAVYRAWDINLNGAVAIKENFDTSPTAQSQFANEATILFNLRHPNLPRVTDHFSVPGQGQYLVMDYVEGDDLEEKCKSAGGFLPENQVLPWMLQVLDALEYLHNEQPPVIHRDIKPANIRITSKGRAMLVDFGIAKIFDAQSKTTVGARAITPGYSPLEQYSRGKTDARSDIYALGATFYNALTGQEPPESVHRTMGNPLPPPRTINPAISPQTERAILQAMEMDMDKRFQSATEFKEALHPAALPLVQSTQSASTWQVNPPAPTIIAPLPVQVKIQPTRLHRNPWVWGGVILLLIVIGIFVGEMIISPGSMPFSLFPSLKSTSTLPAIAHLLESTKTNSPLPTDEPILTVVSVLNPTETSQPSFNQLDCAKPEIFCIGLVSDVGKIDDKSFNQSAYEAVQLAEIKLNAHIQYIETIDTKDYDKNLATFGDAKYDVIITVGFNLGEATQKSALAYPNTKFIGIDQYQVPGTEKPNLVGLNFPEDQAGFLVGALAAMMTKTNIIGAVCGTDAIAPVWRFGEGYRAGAAYINPAVEVIIIYHNDVGFDKTFTDPLWGKMTAISMIDKGADIIFGAGGKTGNGALAGATEKGVYAIGVDTDQYYTVPEAQKVLLSSAMKLIVPSTFDLILMAYDNKFPSGNFYGTAGYAPYHDLDSQVPAFVKAKMGQILNDLISGILKTNVAIAKPGG